VNPQNKVFLHLLYDGRISLVTAEDYHGRRELASKRSFDLNTVLNQNKAVAVVVNKV
jgi:hypothetical protein